MPWCLLFSWMVMEILDICLWKACYGQGMEGEFRSCFETVVGLRK